MHSNNKNFDWPAETRLSCGKEMIIFYQNYDAFLVC